MVVIDLPCSSRPFGDSIRQYVLRRNGSSFALETRSGHASQLFHEDLA